MVFQFQKVRLQVSAEEGPNTSLLVSIPKGTITRPGTCERTEPEQGFNSKRYDYKSNVKVLGFGKINVSIPKGTITSVDSAGVNCTFGGFQFQKVRLQVRSFASSAEYSFSFNSKRYDYKSFVQRYYLCAKIVSIPKGTITSAGFDC